jgi:Flp pilus assembly secretin CpaC
MTASWGAAFLRKSVWCQWIAALGLVALSTGCVTTVQASEALVLAQGGSHILSFRNMVKVVVVDPTIADVVVASRRELVVFGKSIGNTKIYVWDAVGRHEYAVTVRSPFSVTAVVRRVRDLLPSYVEPRAMGDKLIVLTGICPNEGERTRALEIARQVAGSDMAVLDLMMVEGQDVSPAQRAAQQLRDLYGPAFQYVVWGRSTVIVRGSLTPQAVLELQALNEALSGDVKIVTVTTAAGPQPAPVEEIQQAIGLTYTVWALGPSTVVVEGEAPSVEAAERTNKLLEAFSDRTRIVNLVRPAPEPKPSMEDYVSLIQNTLGNEFTVRAVGPATIAVEGVVPDTAQYDKTKELLEALAPGVRILNFVRTVAPEKRRIAIHVKVVDINRDKLQRYGIDWGQVVSGNFVDQPWVVRVERGVNNVYDIGVDVHALESQNYAKVLAEPNLVVNDGEQATMLVGGEIPIPVPQPGGAQFNAITIEYKEYGVNLKIKPEITEGGHILTKVDPEVSTLDFANGVTIAGFVIPAIQTRRASTTVTVPPGGTLVLGGLIRSDEAKLLRKVPVLGDIPIIGELFRRREFKEGKTELVIFLTPEILPPVGQEGESK